MCLFVPQNNSLWNIVAQNINKTISDNHWYCNNAKLELDMQGTGSRSWQTSVDLAMQIIHVFRDKTQSDPLRRMGFWWAPRKTQVH